MEISTNRIMREAAAGDVGVAAQMRACDWSVSPLGAPETWPPSLRSVVGLLLNSKFPMFVAWGSELGLLYNDAYAEILGAKHPAALGARFRDTWWEIWPEISPIIDAALRGEASFHENLPLLIHRRGFDERTWFTFSYSPVHDESGAINGMFCACTETTAAVLAQRSNTFRLALEEQLRVLSDPEKIMAAAAEALGQHLGDARVGYAEVECGADWVEWARVRQEWNLQRLPGIVGQHRLTDYGIARVEAMRAGKTEVATDLAGDPQIPRSEAAAFLHLGIRAQIVVPLVKAGRLVALLFAHAGTARRWTPDEIAAVEDTAERTWAAVERGRAETRLREGEERLRLALEAAGGVGTWDWDVPGERIHVDATFAAFFGIPPERAAQAPPVTDFIAGMHPEDRSRVAAEIEEALDRAGDYTTEYRVIGLDGATRWILVHGHCRHDPEGQPMRFSGVALDISARKQIETEARESAERLRAVFDTVPVGIVLAEAPSGRIMSGNAAAEQIFGHPIRPTADVEYYGEWVAFHPDGRRVEGAEYPLARVFREGAEWAEMEALYRRGDGRDAWVRFVAAPIRHAEDGSVSGGLVVSIDIDHQKRAEAALRESEARLRIATETNGIGTWELTMREDGTAAAVTSPRHDAIFGYPEPVAEWNAEIFLSHVLPEDREAVARTLRDAVEAGRICAFEARIRLCREGELRWIEAHGHPVAHDADGRVARFIGIVQDITARKMAAERLHLLAREVDHRAKNALAVVQSVVQLTPAGDPAAFKRAIEGRVSALARAQTLLAEDRWRGADLRALLEGELAPFRGESHRVVLEGAPVMLPSGAAQPLAMAAHELATNALKHGALSMPAGSVFVAWAVEGGMPGTLRLRWTEAGGPPVSGPPTRRGFGSRVLDGTIRGQLGGRVSLTWESGGLVCEMEVPLRQGTAMAATMDTEAAAESGGWKADR